MWLAVDLCFPRHKKPTDILYRIESDQIPRAEEKDTERIPSPKPPLSYPVSIAEYAATFSLYYLRPVVRYLG